MYLHEIKFVDMKHSKWDKQKSKPKKGEYVFTDKKYVDYEAGNRLDYLFRWNRNDHKAINDWKYKWNFSLVDRKENMVWPEGLVPDAEGHYIYGDVILMKITIDDYLAKKKPEIEKSEMGRKRMLDKFYADGQRQGVIKPGDREMFEAMVDAAAQSEIPHKPGKPLVRPKTLYDNTR